MTRAYPTSPLVINQDLFGPDSDLRPIHPFAATERGDAKPRARVTIAVCPVPHPDPSQPEPAPLGSDARIDNHSTRRRKRGRPAKTTILEGRAKANALAGLPPPPASTIDPFDHATDWDRFWHAVREPSPADIVGRGATTVERIVRDRSRSTDGVSVCEWCQTRRATRFWIRSNLPVKAASNILNACDLCAAGFARNFIFAHHMGWLLRPGSDSARRGFRQERDLRLGDLREVPPKFLADNGGVYEARRLSLRMALPRWADRPRTAPIPIHTFGEQMELAI